MTSTQPRSNGNGTSYNFEVQPSSADQEQVSTQKYIKVTKEQTDDRQAYTQAVLNKLREFVCKAEGEKSLTPAFKEAVDSEVAKLIIALQKIENLLIHKSSRQQTKRIKLKSLVDDVEIALDALNQSEPKIELAKRIRVSIERIINRYQYRCLPLGLIVNRFQDAYESESTPLKVLCGLSIASLFNLLLMGSTVVLLQRQTILETSEIDAASRALRGQIAAQDRIAATANQEITKLLGSQNLQANHDRLNTLEETQKEAQAESRRLNEQLTTVNLNQTSEEKKISKNIRHIRAVLLVITAGTLGSIISILIRIEDFQDRKYWNRATPFLIGAFKPIIGASFAIFFFTLISSELIQIPGINTGFEVENQTLNPQQRQLLSQIDMVDESKEEFFIFAIAFLVGFSERLATDAISKMEDMMGSSTEGKGKNNKDNEVKSE